MKWSTGVIAGGLAMFVAACGSNAASGSHASSSTPAPTAHALTPTTAPAPDLTAELLTTSDLPTGWSVVANSDSGEPKCLDKLRSDVNAVSKAEATFTYGSGIPTLEEYLAYVPGRGQSAMEVASRVLSGCGRISMTSGGQTMSGTVRVMPFPAVADQTSAYGMTMSGTVSGASVTANIGIVVVRKADTLAMIFFANLGGPDTQVLKPLVHDAAAKLS